MTTIAVKNNSFPFMSDREVTLYHEAQLLIEEQHTEDHKLALIKEWNTTELLALWEVMDALKAGADMPIELVKDIENLRADFGRWQHEGDEWKPTSKLSLVS